MSTVGAEAKPAEEKHANLFSAFSCLRNGVTEMEDLLTRVRGGKPDTKDPEQVEPSMDSLSNVLHNLPLVMRKETARLNDIRASLTEELF